MTVNSNGPLGTGEVASLNDGNSILVTVDAQGREVKNYLWIDSFNSDLNMQIDVSQTKRGLTYRPIRLQERILTFNTIWNVKNRDKYIKLVDDIKTHWTANMNEGVSTPCKLTYFGANKTWIGSILNATYAYAITDVVLKYSFNMKLITTITTAGGTASTTGKAPFMPSAGDVTNFGDQWYTKSELEEQVNELIAEGEDNVAQAGRPRFMIPNGGFDPTEFVW